MDGTAAAQPAHPEDQVSPHANGRAPVPPGHIPPGFQKPPPALITGGEQMEQALRAAGRHAEADALHADMANQAAAAAREAAQAEATAQAEAELRELLADPARLLMEAPRLFGDAFGQILAEAVAQGMAAVLQQVVVQTKPRMCSPCLAAQFAWVGNHQGDLDAARDRAMAHLGITDPADPRLGQVDPTPFLPPELRPGAPGAPPQVFDAVTAVGGQDVCPQHHPAAPQRGSGLLRAHGALNPAMIAEAGGIPGVFGSGALAGMFAGAGRN